jgi:hypothetical protein
MEEGTRLLRGIRNALLMCIPFYVIVYLILAGVL